MTRLEPPPEARAPRGYRPEIRTSIYWVDEGDEVLVLRSTAVTPTPRWSVAATGDDPYPGLPIVAAWVRVVAREDHDYHRLLFLSDGSRLSGTRLTDVTFRRPY